MAIIRRPGIPTLYFKFSFNGKQYLRTARTTEESVARTREKQFRKTLTKAFYTPEEAKPVEGSPTFKTFVELPAAGSDGGEWWARYASAEYMKKPNTLAFYEDRVRAMLKCPELADTELDKINPSVMAAFVSFRKKQGVGLTTSNRDRSAMRLVLQKGLEWGYIRQLPILPKRYRERLVGRALTSAEQKVYLGATSADLFVFASIALGTGMEPTPIAELKWSDVHFDAVDKFTHGYIFDRCTKGDLRQREIGMDASLRTLLRERWLTQALPKSEYVFPADRNGRMHPTPVSTFRTEHQRLWKKETPVAIPYFRLYDFRHTHLTEFYQATKDVMELKQRAGWTSLRQADRYIHGSMESRRQATDQYNFSRVTRTVTA